MRGVLLGIALIAAWGSTRAQGQEKLPQLGVLDFQANGASPQLSSALGGVAANELQRLGLFKVVTSEMIRELLTLERQRQLLGCTGESCVSQIGSTIGMDFLVSGRVSKMSGGKGSSLFTLELTLLRVATSTRESSTVVTSTSETELLGQMNAAVLKLVSKILSGKMGALAVDVSEVGASVKVDDSLVGTTPLRGKLPLSAGPHLLVVQKEGFVTVQKEVRVPADQTMEEGVSMIPSPDFIRDYERRQARLRTGAYISTAVAAAGVAALVGFQIHAARLYGSADAPGTFVYNREKVLAGIESDETTNYRLEANSLKSRIESASMFSYVGAGVAGAAAIAAGYFWISGEDPNRYARYREIKVVAGATPLPGGGMASVSVRY